MLSRLDCLIGGHRYARDEECRRIEGYSLSDKKCIRCQDCGKVVKFDGY